MPADAAAISASCLLFNGEDPDAVEAARARWSEAKSAGFEVTYWQADDKGGLATSSLTDRMKSPFKAVQYHIEI